MLDALGLKLVVRYAYEENCTALTKHKPATKASRWARADEPRRPVTENSGVLGPQKAHPDAN
jgi:hypothetical protein